MPASPRPKVRPDAPRPADPTPELIKRLKAGWRRFRLARVIGKTNHLRLKVVVWLVVLSSPVWLINLAVAFFGRTVVFPLSPFFLREKVAALGSYAAHRPLCWLATHPEVGPLVSAAEARHRLPRGLLAAIVQVESGGKPHRISAAGAMGLGQLMPDTARRLGVGDPFDSAANVDGAARLMAQHVGHFHNLRLAIAAYHAGPAAVRNGVPQNGITPDYVARVMKTYGVLRPKPRRRSEPPAGD
jgi:soluble lytic murein transglycosylase-like protein